MALAIAAATFCFAALTAAQSSVANLPRAHVSIDEQRRLLIIEYPPTDLPPSTASDEFMASLPTHQVVIPMGLSIHSARTEVLDSAGRQLPRELLHHVNLTDPSHRDLFVPTAMHILASSKETPPLHVPRFLVGLPLEQGRRLVTFAMVANPTHTLYRGVRVRLILGYQPLGSVFPLFRAYPWALDAMFPLGQRPDGSKGFDLPPGHTVKSWESSPAVPGYVLGVGGHVHDYASSLEWADATTGEVLWHAEPARDSAGRVLSMPVGRFYNWRRLGVHITPSHRYRITVAYDNPTGHLIVRGGMGAVGGLFVPEHGAPWPMAVDTTNAIYRQDLEDELTDDMGPMAM